MKSPDDQFQYDCPRGILGAALLFWGWQSDALLLAAVLAILVEAVHWVGWRVPLTDTQFIRIADLTSVAMAVTGVSFFIVKLSDGLFYLVQWLPLIMVFLLCAQLYSDRRNIPLKAIVAMLRKRPSYESVPANIDLRLPYFFVTIIAASIKAPRTFTFLTLAGFLVFWALWSAKPRRFKPLLWFNFAAMSLLLGIFFHSGLSHLQNKVQEITTDWLQGDWSERDLNRDSTAIGRIGRLKLSEEIIMRVRVHSHDKDRNPTGAVTGMLLQQAEYNRYAGATWLADDRRIEALQKDPATNTWPLARISHHPSTAAADASDLTGCSPSSRLDVVSTTPSPSSGPSTPSDRRLDALATMGGEKCGLADAKPDNVRRVSVAAYLTHGAGVLPLPRGSYAITSNAPGKLSRNAYGAVRIEDAPRLLNYDAYFDGDTTDAGNNNAQINGHVNNNPKEKGPPVSGHDLEVPPLYSRLLADIVGELDLSALPAKQAADRLMQYFQRNFRYTLIQDKMALASNPLQYFLRHSHRGHCEYFATAGVLLLRAAGIPARYVTGFSLSEYDANNKRFIVRKRHAHAWTTAYVNGHWVELDFTPATWASMEADAAPWWQGIYDLASNITYILNQWWLSKPRNPWDYTLLILAVLAGIYLAVKIRPGKRPKILQRKKSVEPARRGAHHANNPGGDSPFYKIIHQLENSIGPRVPGETLKHWLHRTQPGAGLETAALHQLLEQHYFYRFHPLGKTVVDKDRFDRAVEHWLNEHGG